MKTRNHLDFYFFLYVVGIGVLKGVNMNTIILGVSKVALNFVTGLGAGTVVSNAIRQTTPEKVSKLAKVGIMIGGFFLSNMISEKVGDYAEGELNKIVKLVKTMKVEVIKYKGGK